MVAAIKSAKPFCDAQTPGHVVSRFEHFRSITGDATAAAVLVLAEVLTDSKPAEAPSDSLSIAKAAHELGVSKTTVRNLIALGTIRSHRIGTGRGRIRIRREDLNEYQESVHAAGNARQVLKSGVTLETLRELAKPLASRPRPRAA
jgi:excisionase family DNA binding protein